MTPLVCSAVTLPPGNGDLEQIRRRQLGPQSVLLASNRPVSAQIMSPERAPDVLSPMGFLGPPNAVRWLCKKIFDALRGKDTFAALPVFVLVWCIAKVSRTMGAKNRLA